MLVLLQPVIAVLHLLQDVCLFLYALSYNVGKALILLLVEIFSWMQDLFAIFVLIGEELFNFIRELNASIDAVMHYVQTSTTGGINCLLEAISVFCRHMGNFFNTTRFQSRLFATKAGACAAELLNLVKGALLLIADCFWWTLTIIPRTLFYIVLSIGDSLVFGVSAVTQFILHAGHILLEDVFRLTIGAVLVFLLVRHRRRLGALLQRFLVNCKRATLLHWQSVQSSLRSRRTPSNPAVAPPLIVRRSPLRPRAPSSSSSNEPPEPLCVICRDRPKAVLLLPCKHLCVCDHCADYMIYAAHNYHCPLCRSLVEHSMSVYT